MVSFRKLCLLLSCAWHVEAQGTEGIGLTATEAPSESTSAPSTTDLADFPATSLPVVHQWTVQRGTTGGDFGRAMQVDESGNVLVAGQTTGSLDGNTNAGESDVFLMKFNSFGVRQWTVQRGTLGADECAALQVDGSGNAWLAGNTDDQLDGNTNAGEADILLMKIDGSGVHQWTVQHGGSARDFSHALQIDGSGNAWIAGHTYSSLDGHVNAGDVDLFVMKFDSVGAHQWTAQRGGPGEDIAHALQVDAAGNAWLAGTTRGDLDGHVASGDLDIVLMKFDERGVHQWTVLHGGPRADEARALQVDSSDHAWVAGYTESSLDGNTNAGSFDLFLMKFDSSGVHQWTAQRGGPMGEYANVLQVDGRGAWVAGSLERSMGGGDDTDNIFLVHFDSNGVHQWTVEHGGGDTEECWGLQVDGNGNAFLAGFVEGHLDGNPSAGDADIFLAKFKAADANQTNLTGPCPPEYFGIDCSSERVQFFSNNGICNRDRSDPSICKGLVIAARSQDSTHCSSAQNCEPWRQLTYMVGVMFEAELSDMIVAFMAVFFCLLAWRLKCRNQGFMAPTILLATLVSFVADVSLEVLLVTSVGEAAVAVATVKDALCFSAPGDGYDMLVLLNDLAHTITTLAVVNILIALVGGCADIAQARREVRERSFGETAVIITTIAAVAELFISLSTFFVNTLEFLAVIDAIESASLGLTPLGTGGVCYASNPKLPRPDSSGLRWAQPWLIIALPCTLVFSIYVSALVYLSCRSSTFKIEDVISI